ncbi:MAG: double-strand break repair protein AddB [Rhodospirillaceae bacterium]
MGNVFTIPAGFSFVDMLALGITNRYGSDPISLAGVTILLPTRRACRSLRDAFLRLSSGRPMLLPNLSPLGDIDAEGLSMALEEVTALAGCLDLPPALSDLRRRLLLTRVVLSAQGLAATAPQAVRLAADLTRLIDQVETEQLSFERLGGLVPADYAGHWQATLSFLTIVTERWPDILAEEGACDAASRRNLVLVAKAAAWRALPPNGPVIAAGSTGSIPASGELLRVVAGLANGALVLPGLDETTDGVGWREIGNDEAHPQHTLFQLLERLGMERSEVRPWCPGVKPPRPHRVRLLTESLRPAVTTEAWRELSGIDETALEGLTRIDCPTAQEEAEVVALLLRHALEIPERTAALVTPDRSLARRVTTALTRWGILVDDSGGQPLTDTAVGSYLRLAASALVERFEPVALLALLKHPLATLGEAPARCRAFARGLERAALRGPRPAGGIAGLLAAINAAGAAAFDKPERRGALLLMVERLGAIAEPFLALLERGEAPLADLIRAHITFAEAMAATPEAHGVGPNGDGPNREGQDSIARLWRHDDGEEAASFINDLLLAAVDFPAVAVNAYPGLVESLMSGRVVRPRFGRHPRLSILGPLEARLQHVDLMILGGLNEGTWPAEPAADPWMSRPMRRAFGLPAPERQVGLSAHDFAQAAAAPSVVLTRAERVDGAPSVPSRWLSRLDTVLRVLGLDGRIDQEAIQWLAWGRSLDEPAAVCPVAPPEPRPPVAARPRKLAVTDIETWMRDPYAIYARHILKLRPLLPMAADPGASERGQFIHQALDNFVRAVPDTLPADALEHMLGFGRAAFGDMLARPEVWAFWWPRFERIARWFIDLEGERRPNIRSLATEVSGKMQIDGLAGPFMLTAKADRLDRLPCGGLAIIDYKTGVVPQTADIVRGLAPQLPLEAAMVKVGGFGKNVTGPVKELVYWRLGGGDPAGEEKLVRGDPVTLAEQAHGGLVALISAFDDQATPYRSRPRPQHAPRFDDYAHLARVQEWSAGGGE